MEVQQKNRKMDAKHRSDALPLVSSKPIKKGWKPVALAVVVCASVAGIYGGFYSHQHNKEESLKREEVEKKEVVSNFKKVSTEFNQSNLVENTKEKAWSSAELRKAGLVTMLSNTSKNKHWEETWRPKLEIKKINQSMNIRVSDVKKEDCQWLLPELIHEFKSVRIGYVEVQKYNPSWCGYNTQINLEM